MSDKGGSAPAPDPAIGQAASAEAATGQQWLSFAQDAFQVSQTRQAGIDALSNQVTTNSLNWSEQDRSRYENTFVPLQNQFLQTAANYDTPASEAAAAATAKADVSSAAAAEQGTNARQSAAMGISPASGRYAGIDRAVGLGNTAATVGAENTARTNVKQQGLALQADAINMGNGLPAQASSEAGMGINTTESANQQYLASLPTMASGYQGAQAGYANQANILQTQYGQQLDAWQVQQQEAQNNAQGIGGFLGSIGTDALGLILSSKKLKTDKKKVPEGESLDAVKKMPISNYRYKPGIGDGGKAQHSGPMAEDFQAATGKGDGTAIPAQDAIGITMGAVRDLSDKVDRLHQAVGLGQDNRKKMKRAA